mgnify:CR=1 FL=1|tara:strand:- start:8707 stop:8898 length:192 start_codon:yes stop_codon:yes gene_type:complete
MTTGPWIKIICVLTVSGAVLTGCGRKGPLDRPGVTVAPTAADGETAQPAPTGQRRFILDGLLE